MKTQTIIILFLFLCLSCQNVDKNKVNGVTENQPVKTFYADKADFDIVYPSNLERTPAKENKSETNRAGSLTSINLNIDEKDVGIMEVLFHTEKSCSNFYNQVKDIEPEGDFFDESWYSPKEFINQKQAFQKKSDYDNFKYVKYNGVEFLYRCSLSNGETLIECITFMKDTRILTTLGTLKECAEIEEQTKSLFVKLEFKKHGL